MVEGAWTESAMVAARKTALALPSRKGLLSAVESYFSNALENLKLQCDGSVA